ncbi:MAG: ABC transporter substrate-binding protein [Clostridia bacterium]|nr:ABC transporter substrate-binding protein [Clostridia bacterium]
MKKILVLIIMVALMFSTFIACDKEEAKGKGPVTVATMIDSEGAILGNMLLTILSENGFETVDKIGLGTPDILRKALETDEVDLVIDYTGSGQYYGAVADAEVWSDPALGYQATYDFDMETNNIIWLSPAPANNTEMLAVKKEFAEANQLKTMADFANYVNQGGEVMLIASSSFASNELGLVGYQNAYGFELTNDQMIVLSHGNTAEMLKALYDGTNGVNVSLVYGTDGSLKEMEMVVLEDPENVPPVYLPTPVLRGELVEQYPELETMFKAVFDTLTLETLQTLNAKVAFDGEDAKTVADAYLKEKGFIK